MEIEGEDGSRIFINGSKREFGRDVGFHSDDRTVSRRHISFEIRIPTDKNKKHLDTDSEAGVSFQVLGKNPFWVLSDRNGDIRAYRRFDEGEMKVGDKFCVSSRKPILFTLKGRQFDVEENKEKRVWEEVGKRERSSQEELAGSIQSGDGGFKRDEDFGLEPLSVSDVDPIKEFGFVVLGHEFDHYPMKMIREIKDWNWFLEEPKGDSEDDEINEEKARKSVRRKKKKEVDDDEDWMAEREDDQELITKLKCKRAKYSSTRSKGPSKPIQGVSTTKSMLKKVTRSTDEDDDTLGGFIVNDNDVEEDDEQSNNEEEEEEEEEKDYDEEDD